MENNVQNRVFFSAKETTAGTHQTTNFFEGHGDAFGLPEPDYKINENTGKMGTGELGTEQTLEAMVTPWTYKTNRLSEALYFMSYGLGVTDVPVAATTVIAHILKPLPVATLTLPTFSIEFGTGTGNKVYTGCFVNEIQVSMAKGGMGLAEFTISGYGNSHTNVAGVGFVINSAGSVSTGVNNFSAEPIPKFPSLKAWLGATVDAAVVDADDLDFDGENMTGTPTDITTILESFSLTINNGISAEDSIRAGGYGVINCFNRKTRNITSEIAICKDNTLIDTNALITGNTKQALEIQFNGSQITAGNPYALDFLFNVVQVSKGEQDTGTPIVKTIPLKVLEDSSSVSLRVFGQTTITAAYNS